MEVCRCGTATGVPGCCLYTTNKFIPGGQFAIASWLLNQLSHILYSCNNSFEIIVYTILTVSNMHVDVSVPGEAVSV